MILCQRTNKHKNKNSQKVRRAELPILTSIQAKLKSSIQVVAGVAHPAFNLLAFLNYSKIFLNLNYFCINFRIFSKMHLKIGSLKKLINRGRAEFLSYVKDTIENADKILKDDKNGILFTKEFIIKNSQNKQERIFTSHSFRDKNNIQNKLKNGIVIYKKIA